MNVSFLPAGNTAQTFFEKEEQTHLEAVQGSLLEFVATSGRSQVKRRSKVKSRRSPVSV